MSRIDQAWRRTTGSQPEPLRDTGFLLEEYPREHESPAIPEEVRYEQPRLVAEPDIPRREANRAAPNDGRAADSATVLNHPRLALQVAETTDMRRRCERLADAL